MVKEAKKNNKDETRTTTTVSLNKIEDKDIINKLEKVGNKSDYIKALIREDIKSGSNFTAEQREEVLNIIKEFLKDKEVTTKDKEKVDEDIVNALDQFEDF